tara:strand:+ start:332 stop:550 length:219 start_codon:yes stop_codon:yes gene_type:complete
MEEDIMSIVEKRIKRAIEFERRMADIEIKSLNTQLNFFEKRYYSLFSFMNEEQPALVSNWIEKIAAEGVEEE